MSGTNLIADLFGGDGFSVQELSDAINIIPNQWGRIGELDLFPYKGVRTTAVTVEERDGVLNLLPTATRGAPGAAGVRSKRKLRTFSTLHIPHDTQIKADDVQDLRSFGAGSELAQVQDIVNDELEQHRNKHDITREHLRAGALRGDILDADGSELLNLFTEFGVAQTEVDFVLGTSTTTVQTKCFAIRRAIELALVGDVMTSVRALCSPSFFDAFVSHDSVKRAWDFWQGQSNMLGSDPRKNGFTFGGIQWEEYIGQATYLNEDGTTTTRVFIPDGDARVFPVGTRQSFRTYCAPGDFMETVNTIGQPFYAKMAPDEQYNRWVSLHSQQNPLPLCLRPKLLVRAFSSN